MNKIENLRKEILKKNEGKYAPINRPDWDSYFLTLAFVVAECSVDAETRHGCIITFNNRIIGVGYNSFARSMRDDVLPNMRPNKYPYMVHSEINAITNLMVSPQTLDGVTAYITGKPCFNCLQTLWNTNISNIIIADRLDWHNPEKHNAEAEDIEYFILQTGMNYRVVKPNCTFLLEMAHRLHKLDFIQTDLEKFEDLIGCDKSVGV